MNYGAPGSQPGQSNIPQDYMKPPTNLFDENFLNAAQQYNAPKRSDPQLEKDLNVVQNIYSGAQADNSQAPADLSHMSERDRRIYLRDLERKQRNQPGGSGFEQRAYGGEPPPVNNSQPNIFGVQASAPLNDREARLKQKMDAAMNPKPPISNNFAHLQSSPQIKNEFKPATAFGAQLQQQPQLNQDHLQQAQIPSPMRRSLTAQKLQQAKELDVNFNPAMQFQNQVHLEQMQLQNQGPLELMQQAYHQSNNKPPVRNSPLVKQSFELKEQNMISAIGHNSIDQHRRESNKAQQQQEYNKYLASQAAQKSQRAQSASRQMTGDALVQAGMNQIGGHQQRQAEQKARLQKEYQEQLQSQMKQHQQKQMNRSGSEYRRQQLSDQVFNEVMLESGRGLPPQPQHQVYQQQYSELPQIPGQQQSMQQVNKSAHGLPPRVTSAVSARQEQVQRMQRQSLNDPFHKDRRDENSQKRRELEKKREYGQMLQEQMAAKKSQENQQRQMPQHSQNEIPQFYPTPQQEQHKVDFSQGYNPMQQKLGIGNQPATGSWQTDESQLYANPPPQFHQQPQSMPPPQLYQQQQPNSFNLPPQMPSHLDKQSQDPSGILKEREAQTQAADRRKIDAYRLELEMQMKEQEEKKRKLKEEQAKYDMANQQDMASYIQQKPQIVTNMQNHPSLTSNMMGQEVNHVPSQQQQPTNENQAIRHGTDITRQNQVVDPSKQAARQRYQEELRQQMEEQKAKKEAEKQKLKQQDEEMERRIQQEQAQVYNREAAEIVKEGKREPPPAENKGRAIRRDQFEPSQENNGIVGGLSRAQTQPDEPAITTQKHDLFTKAETVAPQPLLPINDNSTFGAHPPINTGNEATNDLFAPPQQKMVSLSSPTNNYMPSDAQFSAPQPPQFSQPPLPSFNQQIQQLQAQQIPQQMSQQPMTSTQSEWAAQQQTQSNKMFEDQQKMIGLYQQALEQILQY